MPDSPVISGVADLPKFYFAEGAPFRLTLTVGAEFSMTGKFVTFGMRARSGTVRRVFGTDSGESNLTIAGQVITLNIATNAATVPAFASGWTLEDVQAKGETEYWVDISATEGSDVLLRLQGQADWVAPGSDIAESSAVVSSPAIDVDITSGAVSVSVAVLGAAEPTLTTNTPTSGLTGILKAASNTLDVAVAGTDYVATNDSRLTDARTPTSHVHGGISNSGAIGSTSGLPIKTGTSGVLEAGAFGTSAGQFAQGNDARFHDRSHAITSTSDHTAGNWKVFHSNGSGQLVELALGANDTFLKSNGASAAPSFATPAGGGGSSITGTGIAYVRTTGNGGNDTTGTIGDPSKPYATAQEAWNDGARVFELGAGSFSFTHTSSVSSTAQERVFIQGLGKEVSSISITWDGIDGAVGSTSPYAVDGGNGVMPSKLFLQSDSTVAISLAMSGGDGGAGGVGQPGTFEAQGGVGSDGGDGSNSPEFSIANAHLTAFSCVVGAPGAGGAGGADGGVGAGGNGIDGIPGNITGGLFSWCYVPSTYTAPVQDVFLASTVAGTGQLVVDGDKGSITVSSNGTTWSIEQGAVNIDRIVSATAKGKIIGRKTAGSGFFEECVIGDFITPAAVTTSNITDTTGAVTNVTGMSFTIAANEKVSAIFRGFWATNTSGSGFKYAFTGPASPTDVQIGDFSFTSATAVRTESGITAFSTTATQGGGTLINSAMPIMIQIYVCNGFTPGTVQLQVGGEVNGSTFTLYKGFTMQVLRIP